MVAIVLAIGFIAFLAWVVDTLIAVRRSQDEILARLARLEQAPTHRQFRARANEELKLPLLPRNLSE